LKHVVLYLDATNTTTDPCPKAVRRRRDFWYSSMSDGAAPPSGRAKTAPAGAVPYASILHGGAAPTFLHGGTPGAGVNCELAADEPAATLSAAQ
jgi:hypothetical protein